MKKMLLFAMALVLAFSACSKEDVPLYDFQKDVFANVKKHYIVDDNPSGMIVMPTGSGKTRTATYFLIKEMISSGYQILWSHIDIC